MPNIGDAYRADDHSGLQSTCRPSSRLVRQRTAERVEADVVRVFVQSSPAVQPSMVALRPRFFTGVRIVARVEPAAQPFGFLHPAARACDSYLRPGFADVSAGASAGHQSLFLRDFHRLGRGDRLTHSRADFPGWDRRSLRGRDWFYHVDHRASSRRQRRHARNVAGGARHQHLARDARGRDHDRLFRHVPRRDAGNHLHRAWRVHPLA